ncbi:unnamed protein product [Rhizoctonia solani]|uniref:CFEM domain-containing protein n=1 Tax=Rhizoctonia solani TaxID=456999 RepID=A0A8H2XFR5_9AGAM|nr:unnamed protein product [Rhizoctonia solani]CAE6451345.1 unnamed protein product [Rhizoctonia solani]
MFHRLSFFIVALFMLFATVAKADYPACGQPCVGVSAHGSCSLTDNTCLCQNSSYCNDTNECFRTSCSPTDWRAAYDYSVSLCAAAGVTTGNIANPPTKRSLAPAHVRHRMSRRL